MVCLNPRLIRVGNTQKDTVDHRDHGEKLAPLVDLIELLGHHGLIGAAAIQHVQIVVFMARNDPSPNHQSDDGEEKATQGYKNGSKLIFMILSPDSD